MVGGKGAGRWMPHRSPGRPKQVDRDGRGCRLPRAGKARSPAVEGRGACPRWVVTTREALRPPDGHRGGPRRGVGRRLYILQAARDREDSGEEAADKPRRPPAGTHCAGAGFRARAIGQKDPGTGRRSADPLGLRDVSRAGGRRCSITGDSRTPIGEPVMKRRGGDRHQSRRAHAHAAIIARASSASPRWSAWRRDRQAEAKAPQSPSRARGDTGHVYEGLLPIEIVEVAAHQRRRRPPRS